MSWLDGIFHRAGKGVIRQQPGYFLAPGNQTSLPIASADFEGAHAVLDGQTWVCNKISPGVWVWERGGGRGSAWSVLTDGDPVDPQIIFDGTTGDVIMVETLR